MQVQIRRISTSSAFLVGMALYGLIGFLVGIVLVVVAGIEVPEGTEPSFIERLGVWAIVVVPLVFGIGAGLLTATAAALYNAVTAVVGGIRVELRSGRPRPRSAPEPEPAPQAVPEVQPHVVPEQEAPPEAKPEASASSAETVGKA